MSILKDIFDASLVGQRFQRLRDNEYNRAKDIENQDMKKQKLEHILKSPANNPEIINQIFNQTGSVSPETISALQAQSPIPSGMEGLTLDQFKDVTGGMESFAKAQAYGVKENPQEQEARQIAKEKRMQDYKVESEGRAEDRKNQKALSGEASKVQSIAKTMIPEIGKIQQAFRSNYKKALFGIVSGTDRELVKLVDQVADKVGRLRSGGAINKDEETRFKRQIASFMDIPFGDTENAITALDGLITEANEVQSGIRPKGAVVPERQSVASAGIPGKTKSGFKYKVIP